MISTRRHVTHVADGYMAAFDAAFHAEAGCWVAGCWVARHALTVRCSTSTPAAGLTRQGFAIRIRCQAHTRTGGENKDDGCSCHGPWAAKRARALPILEPTCVSTLWTRDAGHESPAKRTKTPRLSEQGCPRLLFFVAAKPPPWSSVRIVLGGRSTLNSARRNAALPAHASWCY
jgi:hypothetical protein